MRPPSQRFPGRTGSCVLALVLLLTGALHTTASGSTAAKSTSTPPVIEVLSNRADLVSGGDALVEVRLPDRTRPEDVRVQLDGRDITHEFALRPNGRYQGMVTGLRPGANQLSAWTSPTNGATVTVTNHSKQGPVLAGPQVQPWICETHLNGLGPATGPACVAPTRYDYFYKSTATGRFETYDTRLPPADALIVKTTTDQGRTVPYIVRRERGVIDRGIYDIAVLHQPGHDWDPWAPQPGWNGKLHWYFQGSCAPSHRQAGDGDGNNAYSQGIADVLNGEKLGDLPLSRGWAVAATTLTRLGNNCNDVVSTEMVMMVKEHLTETYGPIRYTTGLGCSGGSLQQHLIANNYPGLLDGLLPWCSWADMLNVAQLFYDCRQFQSYFTNAPRLWADPADRTAVTGEPAGCAPIGSLQGQELWFDPTVGCTWQVPAFVKGVPPATEPDWVYDPQTNPDGVRCTIWDYQKRMYGQRSGDGFANQVMDDTGLQFGLKALTSGRITPEQFVDLNVGIGGRDIDYNPIPRRTTADTEGLRNAYRSGRINDASNLDQVPIIDLRESSNAEVHPDVYSRMTRARLIAANGHADNHVIWTELLGTDVAMFKQAFLTMDRWLAGIEADHSSDPLEVKVLHHKPVNATDTCWAGTEAGACGTDLPYFSSPRLEAGAPMRMDILKCQLKPIDWNDYADVDFTDDQRRKLQGVFPTGVCDWTKPGVEQQPIAGTWQTFTDTVGGRPLPPPPTSTPLGRK